MKKITLKISAFLVLTMFAMQMQGQIVEGTTYNIKNVATGQYLKGVANSSYEMGTLGTGGAEFNFTFVKVLNGGTEYWNIDSELRGIMRGVGGSRTTVHTTKAPPATDVDKIWTSVALGSGVYQFYLRDNTTMLMQWDTGDAALEMLKDDDGTDTSAHWQLEVAVLSNNKFDTSSIFISNPVNNELEIKGLSSNVKLISVYSLLGKEVLTKNVAAESALNLNISALVSGMYLVKIQGDNGAFTKKIVKQ